MLSDTEQGGNCINRCVHGIIMCFCNAGIFSWSSSSSTIRQRLLNGFDHTRPPGLDWVASETHLWMLRSVDLTCIGKHT